MLESRGVQRNLQIGGSLLILLSLVLLTLAFVDEHVPQRNIMRWPFSSDLTGGLCRRIACPLRHEDQDAGQSCDEVKLPHSFESRVVLAEG